MLEKHYRNKIMIITINSKVEKQRLGKNSASSKIFEIQDL